MPVRILADSINTSTEVRLTTFLLERFPKFLQAELRTHRATSQSHYSSRAIPIEKVISQLQEDPFIPTWTQHQKGMAGADTLSQEDKAKLTEYSLRLRDLAIAQVLAMHKEVQAAKECANRYLEPWMTGSCIVTADSEGWNHFFKLRTAEGVHPDFKIFAVEMFEQWKSSKPQHLKPNQWHIPFVDDLFSGEYGNVNFRLEERLKIASARAARCSYLNHDGGFSSDEDYKLHDHLVSRLHMTPLEHSARAIELPLKCRNLFSWCHYRQHIEEQIPLIVKDIEGYFNTGLATRN